MFILIQIAIDSDPEITDNAPVMCFSQKRPADVGTWVYQDLGQID